MTKPNLQDTAAARIENDLSGISFREPVIDLVKPEIHVQRPGESRDEFLTRIVQYNHALEVQNGRVDNEWMAVTEAVRRAIISDPETRKVAAIFNTLPLSESLPAQAVEALTQTDERTARIAKRTGKTLGRLLTTEEVPDELIAPDITHAPRLRDKHIEAKYLQKSLERSEKRYLEDLDHIRRRVEDRPGISDYEKQLVARRYRYARDVKILGLMAELRDWPFAGSIREEDELIAHELPSGTQMVMSERAFQQYPTLLDPSTWESRKQMKDRVYKVSVAGEEFLLKERKTPRHTDTKSGGHKNGLTSREEFQTASEYAELGEVVDGDISVVWERPLGYVEFPDGYQFCLFEIEPRLYGSCWDAIEDGILDSPEVYRAEYDAIKARAKQLLEDRKDLINVESSTLALPKKVPIRRFERKYKKWYKKQPEADELTFEEFAKLKARQISQAGRDLLYETTLSRGYYNSDQDGFAYRITKDNNTGRVRLQVVGFDFEYYFRYEDEQAIKEVKERVRQADESGETARSYSSCVAGDRPISLAASYALAESMGFGLPAPRDQGH